MKHYSVATVIVAIQGEHSCQALDQAEGSPAGTMINFVNQVAEEVEKEFPHVLVGTLAYIYTAMPAKTLRPRHNVAIQMCTSACR